MIRTSLEFIISIFGNLLILPELVEVDAQSKKLLEFSFDKKSKTTIQKQAYLQNRLIEFINGHQTRIATFNLHENINAIMQEVKKLKNGEMEAKTGSGHSKKQMAKKGQPSNISAVNNTSISQDSVLTDDLKVLTNSFVSNNSKEDSHLLDASKTLDKDPMGLRASRGRLNVNQTATYPQEPSKLPYRPTGELSSTEKKNYNININLVLNDNANDSSNISGNTKNLKSVIHQELGLNNTLDSSSVMGDSLFKLSIDKSFSNSKNHSGLLNEYTSPGGHTSGGSGQVEGYQSQSQAEHGSFSNLSQNSDLKLPDGFRDEGSLRVMAIADFEPERENDLGFRTGDFIVVKKRFRSGWWIGYLETESSRSSGYFPRTYVTEV